MSLLLLPGDMLTVGEVTFIASRKITLPIGAFVTYEELERLGMRRLPRYVPPPPAPWWRRAVRWVVGKLASSGE